jgi:hypothetical protein
MRNEWPPLITVLLTGCRPWPPGRLPARHELCPVCAGGVVADDDGTMCLWCHSVSPASDRRLHSAYIATERRQRAAAAGAALESRLRAKPVRTRRRRKDAATQLSERVRRGYWYGGTRRFRGNYRDLASTIHLCRVWLKEIGQEPDWSLTHDRFGPLPGKREAA